MTRQPTGTHENVPFSNNITDEYNCPSRSSIMYFTCYEWEEKGRLFDFSDHQLDSHFRTEREQCWKHSGMGIVLPFQGEGTHLLLFK